MLPAMGYPRPKPDTLPSEARVSVVLLTMLALVVPACSPRTKFRPGVVVHIEEAHRASERLAELACGVDRRVVLGHEQVQP
jgi:hypothetical protein